MPRLQGPTGRVRSRWTTFWGVLVAAVLLLNSSVVVVAAAAATKYLVTSSSYAPVAGTTVTISAQLADADGGSVATAGKVVTWTKSDTNGSFATTTSTTNASGIATVVFTTHTVVGTVTTVTGPRALLPRL